MGAKPGREMGKSDLFYQEEKRRPCLAALVAINHSKKMRPSEVHVHPVIVPLNDSCRSVACIHQIIPILSRTTSRDLPVANVLESQCIRHQASFTLIVHDIALSHGAQKCPIMSSIFMFVNTQPMIACKTVFVAPVSLYVWFLMERVRKMCQNELATGSKRATLVEST